MSDFIKKDVIEKEIKKWDLPTQELFNELIDSVPTFDAVSVVRCRDCKYFDVSNNECYRPNYTEDGTCYAESDEWCSYGERIAPKPIATGKYMKLLI